MKTANLRIYLYYASAIILLAGLGSAVLIYETSQDNSRSVVGYEREGGSIYPIEPDDSKQYLRGLELYGGTANVLADELRRWFDGLWHGKSLALTVACISISISLGVLYVAGHLRPHPEVRFKRQEHRRTGLTEFLRTELNWCLSH